MFSAKHNNHPFIHLWVEVCGCFFGGYITKCMSKLCTAISMSVAVTAIRKIRERKREREREREKRERERERECVCVCVCERVVSSHFTLAHTCSHIMSRGSGRTLGQAVRVYRHITYSTGSSIVEKIPLHNKLKHEKGKLRQL